MSYYQEAVLDDFDISDALVDLKCACAGSLSGEFSFGDVCSNEDCEEAYAAYMQEVREAAVVVLILLGRVCVHSPCVTYVLSNRLP